MTPRFPIESLESYLGYTLLDREHIVVVSRFEHVVAAADDVAVRDVVVDVVAAADDVVVNVVAVDVIFCIVAVDVVVVVAAVDVVVVVAAATDIAFTVKAFAVLQDQYCKLFGCNSINLNSNFDDGFKTLYRIN